MATGLALLKEASYAFLPQLLAKGNFRESKSSGYFPTYLGDSTLKTDTFTMYDMQEPYGYRPDEGKIALDSVLSYIKNNTALTKTDWPEVTVFYDVQLYLIPDPKVVELMSLGSTGYNTVYVRQSYQPAPKTNFRADVYIDNVQKWKPFLLETPVRASLGIIVSNRKLYAQWNGGPRVEIGADKTWSNNLHATNLILGANLGGTVTHQHDIYTAAFFPRALTQEEATHLHEQSALGFPGLRADAYGPNNEFAKLSRTRRRSFGLGSSVSCSVGVM